MWCVLATATATATVMLQSRTSQLLLHVRGQELGGEERSEVSIKMKLKAKQGQKLKGDAQFMQILCKSVAQLGLRKEIPTAVA